MNFQNMETEIKKYSDFFKYSQSTILKLSTFYKEIGKIGSKFADRMKKLLDEFFVELIREDRSTTYNKLLTNFYNEKNRFINKIKSYFSLLEKNYGERLSDFEKDHQKKNKETLLKLNKLKETLTDSKNNVDKWKNQYFDMCKSIVETGKKIKNLEEANQKNNGKSDNAEILNKLNVSLTKYKDLKELKKKNYKEEQIKLNKLLEANENTYLTLVDSISKEYCNKINFIHKILNEINLTSTNFTTEFNESIKKVETLREELNVRRDEKSFKQDFNFFVGKDNTKVYKRFVLEEFLDYDYVITNNENQSNLKDNTNNLNKVVNTNDNDDYEIYRAKMILNIGEQYFVDLNNLNDKGKEINTIISNLLNCENKIEDVDFLKIINYIENNSENCNNFMELLATHFCQNEFVIIKNIENFHNLINVLIIILNYSFDKKDIFDICFLVMFVAEKGIYLSKDDDTHITNSIFKIISKQSIFNSVNFWKDLINARIKMVAKIDIRKEFEKRRKNINNNSNTFFGKLFGGKKDENEIIENEILQSQIYKEKSNEYFISVFYYYIKHFLNFNLSKAEELLDSFKTNYNLEENIYEFFKKIIKSDNYFKKEKEKNMGIQRKNGFFDYKPNKQFKNIDNMPIKSILFSLKYIDKEQYCSIICLNKKYHKNILKIIYKNILLYKNQSNITIKKHIDIWKILLDYKSIKKEYNYQEIKESNKNPDKKIPCSDIIELDIIRTFFSKNKEERMEKIKHILKAIASELPNLTYYQGMNQIAAFLLNICDDNEEEAFYLFMSFLKNTEYMNLFKDDLVKMNELFYQFDRFINLYLPELYIFFKVSSISSGYFISPWFITLFTNAFIDIDEKKNDKTIMMIWDLFIFSGWKSLMKIGIILLKIKEKFIVGKLSECLLPFLTGEILKSEIMDCEHFEQLRELCSRSDFKISNKLFEDIQKEYEIKKNCAYFADDTHVNTY